MTHKTWVAALFVVGACRDRAPHIDQAGASSVAAAQTPAVTGAAPATSGDRGCRNFGDWATCSVEDRLRRAGLLATAHDDAAVGFEFMQTKSARYRLGAGDDELLVFVYASAAARRLVTDGLDSLSVAPKGTRGRYRVAPLLVTSNNLAAIVLSANGRQLERVSLALSAGLPPHQP